MLSRTRRTFPDDYELRDGVHVARGGTDEAFAYNDGDDAETYLLDVIGAAADRSVMSPQLAAGIRDWPSNYHLSRKRANLLRPFGALLRGAVLEVGAGCGAITRYLGENGGDVVAIEGSARRARIARTRTADLKNVSVVCEQLDGFSSKKRFDVALSIGVLEYAGIYGADADEPHVAFLRNLAQSLSRNGVVIVAIENRLGLKYFAGAREDHLGTEFGGINGNYGKGLVATFGRGELADLLQQAGLPEQAFFYPCPDYKLPITVLSDPLLAKHPALAADLLAQSTINDPQRPPDPTFSLEIGWTGLVRNGLLGDLANSFLVVAAASKAALAPWCNTKEAAWHYAVERHPAFTRETRFAATRGGLSVTRAALSDLEAPPVPIRCAVVEEPYAEGENWWNTLAALMNTPGWTLPQLADWARPWLGALAEKAEAGAFDARTARTPVAGAHFDAVPFNMVRTAEGGFVFFDQEWQLTPDVELGYIAYRGLHDSLARVTSCAAPASGTSTLIADLVVTLLADNGVMATRQDIERYALMEDQIQAWVQGRIASQTDEHKPVAFGTLVLPIRAPLERQALAQEMQTLRADLGGTQGRLGETERSRDALGEELARSRDLLQKQETDIARLSSLAAERDGALAALRDDSARQIEALNRDIGTARRYLAESQTQTQSLAGELSVTQDNLAKLRAQHIRLEQERNAAAEQARAAAAQLATTREAAARDAQIAKDTAAHLAATLAAQARDLDARETTRAARPFANIADRAMRAVTPWKRTRYRARGKARDWEAGVIRASRLFRPLWYLERHPDVAAAGTDPLAHYILHGAAEGRAPHPLFDPDFYAAQLPEPERGAMSPLAHYASAGVAAGLNPHPLFDTAFYLRANPDVAAAGVNPLAHYMEHGARELRNPNPLFDAAFYLRGNPAAKDNPLLHYLGQGVAAPGNRQPA